MANIKRLREALRWTREHPEQADQASWVDVEPGTEWPENGFAVMAETGESAPPCGTTLCFAGTIEYLFAPAGTRLGYMNVTDPEGRARYFKEAAIELAELTSGQAGALFITARDITDLERMVDEIARNPHASGDDLYRVAHGMTEDADLGES